jgi:hypothetical protein
MSNYEPTDRVKRYSTEWYVREEQKRLDKLYGNRPNTRFSSARERYSMSSTAFPDSSSQPLCSPVGARWNR